MTVARIQHLQSTPSTPACRIESRQRRLGITAGDAIVFPDGHFSARFFPIAHTTFAGRRFVLVEQINFHSNKKVPARLGTPKPPRIRARRLRPLDNIRGVLTTMTKILGATAIAALAFTVTACSSTTSPVSPSPVASGAEGIVAAQPATSAKPSFAEAAKPGPLTIVGIVLQKDGEFDVLQAAVIRAGLVDVLNGTSQYTVFAPTDLAFVTSLGVANEAAAIAAVNSLPVDTLTDILLFHVTEGRRNSRSVLAAPSYQMVNGATLTRTQLAAAGLAATDISASNGIVHVINAVLFPGQ
jgi:uncharacterized surface protein with fasciclin (FAS1) repeats